ncbi:MAG: DUF1553 domain-containing protein [Planctomycetota bacterium]|nr:MAG: DUF1553 domain-containing protein [Planctomycetota bacterium]
MSRHASRFFWKASAGLRRTFQCRPPHAVATVRVRGGHPAKECPHRPLGLLRRSPAATAVRSTRIGAGICAAAVACVILPGVLRPEGLPAVRADDFRARLNSPAVDFRKDVRPILAKNCFRCHGIDEADREAGLRLDIRDAAIRPTESGAVPIVPGHPEQSEVIRRIRSNDEFERMPPPDTGLKLTRREIETLERWIRQGAPYERHWAFVPPRRPPLPPPAFPDADVRNPIDLFVQAKLKGTGLRPSPPADRYTLIRRVSLDLRGLPPSPEEVAAFVNDPRPDAYERLVDRLLADPGFGERWARVWLDLARYADSRGYGSDPLRPNMWLYRNWVIDAFNRNLPFDQFTIEQLAGDLLPDATEQQRVATAFHRNTMTNTEGGTDDEEFRVAAVMDRVDTTIQVWMGLTMGCAKCHNHKYDPISQKEYYQFFAIFNQTADADRPDEAPVMQVHTDEYRFRLARHQQQVSELKRQIAELQREIERQAAAGDAPPVAARFVRIELPGRRRILSLAEVQVFSAGRNVALQGKARQSSTAFDGPARLAIDGNTDGDYNQARSTTHTNTEDDPWWEVDLGDDFPVDAVVVWNRTDNGLQSRLNGFVLQLLDAQRRVVWSQTVAKAPQRDVTLTPKPLTPQARRLTELQNRLTRLERSAPQPPTVPIMQELPPDRRRKTHVLIKGNFLSPGEPVEPDVPHAFHELDPGLPKNRLGAARWLVDRDNPLTARVFVNRLWAQLFGAGIVLTEEDFGTQGEFPTHPELLDWLAVEFMRDWDTKRMLRLMVTSATYRQTSVVTPDHRRIDPDNRLLARAPRFRLDAETIRDQALALAGLLSRKIGGPSVYPYQPPGLWRAAFNGQRSWPTSKGEDKYRRGIYTFWRRTVPYPSMAAFDAPSREVCTIRRIRTNTPLQAFVTLNDPVYVEAAQALARRILAKGGATDRARARFGLSLCLARPPSEKQIGIIERLYRDELDHYRRHPEDAKAVATEPLGAPPPGVKLPELAAWTVVANVLLNMDGVLVRN